MEIFVLYFEFFKNADSCQFPVRVDLCHKWLNLDKTFWKKDYMYITSNDTKISMSGLEKNNIYSKCILGNVTREWNNLNHLLLHSMRRRLIF